MNRRSFTLTFALLLAGCSSSSEAVDAGADPDTCDPPGTVGYDCEPQPAGSEGCSGSPLYYGTSVPDPDAVFAEGCEIVLPFCNPYYPSFVASCFCQDDGDGAHWTCPI